MRKLVKMLNRLGSDRKGVTALEYGLIAFLIAVVIVTNVTNVGNSLATVFGTVNTKLTPTAGG